MRDPLHTIPVRSKLALLFIAVCVLAFGVGGSAILGVARAALVKEIRARVEEQSRDWAAALDADLRMLASRTEDFASDGYLRERVERLFAASPGSAAALERELVEQLARKKPLVEAFRDLLLVDSSGRALAASPGASPDLSALARPILIDGAGRRFSEVLRPEPDRIPTIAIAVPLRGLDGTAALGTLVSFVHAGVWVTRAVTAAGLAKGSAAEAVQLTILDPRGTAVQVSRVLTGPDAPAPDSEVVRAGFGLAIDPPNAEPSHAAARAAWPLSAPGWQAGVARPGPPDFSAVGGLQSKVLAAGIVLCAISLLLLWFPMRYLARPLVRMREAVRRIETGDFSARVEVESKDEIGELARSFNTMAEAVDERTQRLEKAAQDLAEGQARLRGESERLAAVISSMRDGLVVLDAGGQPVLSNAAAGPLLELVEKRKQVTSHHICHDVGAHASCSDCLLDAEAPPRSCVLDSGKSVIEVHATRLPGGRGAAGRVLVSRDITDRVVQDERQIHQERLAVIGEVASVMAHELNNPLAAISMFSQMMEGELPEDSSLREPVAVIRRNTESCKRAIREVLDYATDATPEVAAVDLDAVLEDVARFLRPMCERNGVAWSFSNGSALPVVTGDEVQLRQIFVNLCVNAIQAMPRGGALRVTLRDEGEHLEIDVADTGPGIPDDAREAVFRPFYTTKARGEGTGLGLPTARRIAEIHGGTVVLAETGPTGTTFRARLRRRSEVAV